MTVTLPESDAGFVTSDLSCFTTGVPFLTAICEVDKHVAVWKNVTWHDCEMEQETKHTSRLRAYATTTINKENVHKISANLSSETQDPSSLSNQDVTYAAITLMKMADMENLDISVVKSTSETVSNLMNVNSSILGNFSN